MKVQTLKIGRMKTVSPIGASLGLWWLLAGCGGSSGAKAPVILPASGTYTYPPVVSIQNRVAGSTVYYTTDGSTPTSSSPVYSSSTYLQVSQSETVNAISISGSTTSPVGSATYTINLPAPVAPVFSPAPGGYTSAQAVTITTAATAATIYYTTDGSTPTTSSQRYTGQVAVSATETLQAIAVSSANYGYGGSSAVTSGAYTILSPPVFSPTSGTYTSAQMVTLSDVTPGASIYYTTDGSAPTTASTLYTSPIMVGSNEILNALATVTPAGGSLLTSSEVSSSYVIHLPGTSFVLSGTALSGVPVIGATVQLYEVGMTGYTSAATPLLAPSLVTDNTGAFSLGGNYTCTAGAYVYLTAFGGTTTAGQSSNSNLTFAAPLGLCDNLTATSSFTINEETTVATAYALAQFSQGSTFGQAQANQPGSGPGAPPADNFATSATNIVGLANAMQVSQLLATTSSGTSPGNNSNASAFPEWWQMNLVADMLAGCARSNGGSSNACETLFGNVIASGGKAPADTLQAALDLALTPVVPMANIANLYALISSTSAPFQPYPAAASAITDFSMAIEYLPLASGVALLAQPSAIALDSLGNAWVANQPTGAVTTGTLTTAYPGFLVELTPTGVPVQAGATADKYAINSYSINGSGTSTTMGGQYTNKVSSYGFTGLFAASIDTSNNVWINDRQNTAMVEVTGSGTTYSPTLAYQNGGDALDSGGNGAVGTRLPAGSGPASTYIDGSNNVWFQMSGASGTVVSPSSSNCGTGSLSLSGTVNEGIAVFAGESTSNAKAGFQGNAVNVGTPDPYIVVDPNVGDVTAPTATGTATLSGASVASVTITSGASGYTSAPSVVLSGAGGSGAVATATINGGVVTGVTVTAGGSGYTSAPTVIFTSSQTAAKPIPGAPFEWSLGNAGNSTGLIQAYTSGTSTMGCETTLGDITPEGLGDTLPATTAPASNKLRIPPVPLPNAFVAGDLINFMGTGEDMSFDKLGNLWIANSTTASGSHIDTQTSNVDAEIKMAISKVTPNYGSSFLYSNTSFSFSVFHQVGGLYDGISTYYPQFLTTDGGGNIWYTMSSAGSKYVNAITNTGTSLSPYTVQTEGSGLGSATAGFAGSVCTNCTFNGTTTTFQRPNTLVLSRPAVDQSGDVWLPVNGSGSNYVDVLIGIATPKANPDSLALSNGKFASEP
jgi:hypothetical protein